MRLAWVILLSLAAGCTQPPATFGPVEYPAKAEADWIRSGPGEDSANPLAGKEFREEPGALCDLRVTASPADFYGSKLYDGLDVTLQPLDASGKPLRKLGGMTATLYRFEGETYEGKGEKLLEWRASPERMAGLWAEKGIDRGYAMRLAWDRRPMVKDVRLEVRFETRDGKSFAKIVSAGSVDQPRYRWLDK